MNQTHVKTRIIGSAAPGGRFIAVLSSCLLLAAVSLFWGQTAHAVSTINTNAHTQHQYVKEQLNEIGHYQRYVKRQFKFAMQAFQGEEFTLAFRIFMALAELDHIDSQYYLGMHYDMGVGVEKNMKTANFWYSKAALKGDNRAQHNLAVAYAKGDGVESDILMALKLWLQSAKQGNTDSAYNLGILYAVGHEGVAANPAQAMKWWRKAAMDGDGYAQYNLGTMLANGEIGARNYCEAIHWWKLSVSNGVAEAGAAIQVLKQRQDYSSCKEGK